MLTEKFLMLVVVVIVINSKFGIIMHSHCQKTYSQDNCEVSRPTTLNFIALLYNPKLPDLVCVGAVISSRWIIDHCFDEPEFTYEMIQLGSAGLSIELFNYTIVKRVVHQQYVRGNFNIAGVDTQYMFATKNALVLHKTDRQINFVVYTVGTIRLYTKAINPRCAYAVHRYDSDMLMTSVKFASRAYCNKIFESHFSKGEQIYLSEKQLCTYSNFTEAECCHSQAMLLVGDRLYGIMAWSTACSAEIGIDPWVFQLTLPYINWIKHIIQERAN